MRLQSKRRVGENLLLDGSLLDLVQLHVEPRPELFQLDVLPRAFSALNVSTSRSWIAAGGPHLYKWWRN